jgi:hypothetical protein
MSNQNPPMPLRVDEHHTNCNVIHPNSLNGYQLGLNTLFMDLVECNTHTHKSNSPYGYHDGFYMPKVWSRLDDVCVYGKLLGNEFKRANEL